MIGRLNIFAAVLAEHRLHVARCTCLAWDADLMLDARRVRIEEQHRLHQADALDAALAAQEGERGGAEVAAEWASNYDFRPHSDRASAEGVRARFGGFIYTRERTSFPDSVTAWRRADHIEAQP